MIKVQIVCSEEERNLKPELDNMICDHRYREFVRRIRRTRSRVIENIVIHHKCIVQYSTASQSICRKRVLEPRFVT